MLLEGHGHVTHVTPAEAKCLGILGASPRRLLDGAGLVESVNLERLHLLLQRDCPRRRSRRDLEWTRARSETGARAARSQVLRPRTEPTQDPRQPDSLLIQWRAVLRERFGGGNPDASGPAVREKTVDVGCGCPSSARRMDESSRDTGRMLGISRNRRCDRPQ